MEVIQNGSTPNDHSGLDTSQINDKLYIFVCGWKTHPSGHVVVFFLTILGFVNPIPNPPNAPNSPPPKKKKKTHNKYIQQGTNISPSQGIYLKMIFLFPRWDMWSFPGGQQIQQGHVTLQRLPLGRSAVYLLEATEETPSDQCFTSWWFQIFSPLLGEDSHFD